MALRAMAAGGQLFFCGSAAAGVAEFFYGRAGIPVAGTFRYNLVRLAAGAGVQGRGFVLISGFHSIMGHGFCIFGHSFTSRTVVVR
jgi:hypothetical protein